MPLPPSEQGYKTDKRKRTAVSSCLFIRVMTDAVGTSRPLTQPKSARASPETA